MATMDQSWYYIQTTHELGYINTIEKIPEAYRILQNEHHMLPCANDYSMMALYDNPFTIISTIYGNEKFMRNL